MQRLLALALPVWAGLLVGCVPFAVLRTPEPARGSQFTVGGSLLAGFSPGRGFEMASSPLPVVLPYIAYASGDGNVEYNFTFQMGPRGGVKVALGEGLALDAGLNLPLLASYEGLPLAADLGLLVGAGSFYLSPRLHGLGFQTTDPRWRSFGVLLYQLNLGYQAERFLIEMGGLGGIGGGAFLINLSAGLRF